VVDKQSLMLYNICIMKVYVKFFLFFPFVLFFLTIILLFLLVGMSIIIFTALSLTSVVISLGVMVGLLGGIASDLAPAAIFFAGVFCGAFALLSAVLIRFTFPKALVLFTRVLNGYRLYEN